MATNYVEFTTTGANLLADIGAAILGSSDWSKPNAGARPNTYKAVTTRGAQMVIDLNDSAPTVNKLTAAFYTSYDGATLGTKSSPAYLYYKSAAGSFATTQYRCVVSAGKEHLFLSIEGPGPFATGADAALYGSLRNYIFMNDLNPYFDNTIDTLPAIVAGGGLNDTVAPSVENLTCWMSNRPGGQVGWTPARLLSLAGVAAGASPGDASVGVNRFGPDGNLYLSPYVVFGNEDGIRGRLNSFFFAGFPWSSMGDDIGIALPGLTVNYGGAPYRLLPVNKGNATYGQYGPFGIAQNGTPTNYYRSPIVAVPTD